MLAKGFGGAERSFVDTSLELAARGHQIQAICCHDFAEVDRLKDIDGLQVDTVRSGAEWNWFVSFQIGRLIAGFGAEVIHTQLRRAAWHGAKAGKRLRIPVVSKLHNYVDLKRYENVDHILATTQDQRAYALAHGWAEGSVSVIPNFSRVTAADSVRPMETAPVRLLSYGRLVEKKGFDILLNAFARLIADGVDARLRIGGRGVELARLQSLAVELGIDGKVSLGDWIDCVQSALDQADLFILPSLDEPFGIVMLEAMARGVPIVSTLTQGPSEVLDDSTAHLVEIGSVDSLYRAMKSATVESGDSSQRARHALERYKTGYSADAVVPMVEGVYRDLLAARSRSE